MQRKMRRLFFLRENRQGKFIPRRARYLKFVRISGVYTSVITLWSRKKVYTEERNAKKNKRKKIKKIEKISSTN